MPSSAVFNKFYKQLNPAQRKAVDAIEGPVMVVAGPGTGKTQILTLRIANILRKTDTAPENILALTFTESAAASLRRRLVEIIGSAAYSVVINTFHGFCNDIIKTYPEVFPRIIGSASITEVDQLQILEGLIAKLPLKELKPFGDALYYVKDIENALNDLKREGIDPKRFKKLAEDDLKRFNRRSDLYHEKGAHKGKMRGEHQRTQKYMRKNEELARIYAAYEKELARTRRYDYADMIVEVLRELTKNKDLLLILQEQHQYLLADEHQDTNNAQNRIMELLANFHENPNVFVVGDEKQAIFRFQGASLENFLYFKKLYPRAKLVVLEENYRSTQAILDSAESVIAGEKKLKANAGHKGQPVALYSFSRPEVEAYFVARDIERKLSRGVPAHDIAVLYRDNKDVLAFAHRFEKAGVPFSIESDEDVLSDRDIQKLVLLFRAVDGYGSDGKLAEAMHVDFLRIHPLDLYKMVAHATRQKRSLYDVIRSKRTLAGLDLENADAVSEFSTKLALWRTFSKNRSLAEFFELMVRESGLLAHLLKEPNGLEKLEKLNGFFDEVKMLIEKHSRFELKDLLGYLDTLASHNLLIKKSSLVSASRGVRCMTAHRAKGQEFGFVFIVSASDGHWGNRRAPRHLELPSSVYSLVGRDVGGRTSNEDERRLFYVALTRAKRGVTITYSTRSATRTEQLPSQFVEEIQSEFIERRDSAPYEKEFDAKKELVFSARAALPASLRDTKFIRALFRERGLSVTGLNNYLECPWNYFYMNLLRVPMAPTKHQLYGIAVHAALKDFFSRFRDERPTKQTLLASFLFHMKKQPFNKADAEESLEKGKRALAGWYDTYHGRFAENTLNELTIPAIMLAPTSNVRTSGLAPDIRLTGKIDKLEFLGSGNEVNVVDYKTSKPKTRGELEGTTKNSNGDEKRQLVFYQLLLDRYHDGKKYKMVSADIDFIEPVSGPSGQRPGGNDKGRYKKERFVIAREEVLALEDLIKKTAEEITTLAFYDTRCDKKDCEFCALREMMK